MQILEEVAPRHGLACLVQEKPFAGINGSGERIHTRIHTRIHCTLAFTLASTDAMSASAAGMLPPDRHRSCTLLC